MLYYSGTLPANETERAPLLAIVGTRKCGSEARQWALDFAREAARAGVNTVSGLALGIDAMAHRGCVDGGGASVGVLGSALDMFYPASNRALARRMVNSGGCLLSEYPLGTRPTKWTFPERNRIIAGMARGTLVVAAPAASGALITARDAFDENRDVFVARARDGRAFGEGTEGLIEKDMARPVQSVADVLADWGREAPPAPEEEQEKGDMSLAEKMARELGI
jgi:DNA processing protein